MLARSHIAPLCCWSLELLLGSLLLLPLLLAYWYVKKERGVADARSMEAIRGSLAFSVSAKYGSLVFSARLLSLVLGVSPAAAADCTTSA